MLDEVSVCVCADTQSMSEELFTEFYSRCSMQRRQLVDRYQLAKDKYLSVTVYLLLLATLQNLGRWSRDEEAPEFEFGQFGKPRLCGSGSLHFNLSHSGGVAACAVSQNPVGIDVQAFGGPVILSVLSCKERQDVLAAKNPQTEFVRLWTWKEAYYKYLGIGLSGLTENKSGARGLTEQKVCDLAKAQRCSNSPDYFACAAAELAHKRTYSLTKSYEDFQLTLCYEGPVRVRFRSYKIDELRQYLITDASKRDYSKQFFRPVRHRFDDVIG